MLIQLSLALLLSVPARCAETAKPWIGIQLGSDSARGVPILAVIPATPAEKAGLAAGDRVLSVDGLDMSDSAALIKHIQSQGVGQKVLLKLLRDGKPLDVSLRLEARPNERDLVRGLVGKPAPPFELFEGTGPYRASLSELKGQVIVLEFWATWCGPCRQSFPRLSWWQRQYGKRGLRVIGINADDDQEAFRAFVEEHAAGLAHSLALDLERKAAGPYLIRALPTMFVIDRKGLVVDAVIGGGEGLDAVERSFRPLLDPE